MRVPTEAIRALPGETVCYVPGVGEVTLAEVARARIPAEGVLDSEARTVAMWGWIVTHPDEPRPWRNTGRTRVASAESTA